MPLKINCSQGHRLTVPKQRAGTAVRCPICGEKVQIPGDGPAGEKPAGKTDFDPLAFLEEEPVAAPTKPAAKPESEPPRSPKPPSKKIAPKALLDFDPLSYLEEETPKPVPASPTKYPSAPTPPPPNKPEQEKRLEAARPAPTTFRPPRSADPVPSQAGRIIDPRDLVPPPMDSRTREHPRREAIQKEPVGREPAPVPAAKPDPPRETALEPVRPQSPTPVDPPKIEKRPVSPSPATKDSTDEPPVADRVRAREKPVASVPPPAPSPAVPPASPERTNARVAEVRSDEKPIPPPPSLPSPSPAAAAPMKQAPPAPLARPSPEPLHPYVPPSSPIPSAVPPSPANIPVTDAGPAPLVAAAALPEPAPPPKIEELPGLEHRPDQLHKVYYIAAALGALALFSMAPAVVDLADYVRARMESEATPGLGAWVYCAFLVGLLQLAYAAYTAQLPDWSSVWVVAIICLLVAVAHAGVLALFMLAPTDNSPLASLGLTFLVEQRRTMAALWCLCIVALNGLLTFFSGQFSYYWHRTTLLVPMAAR